jgi:hypothetical protein
MGAKINNYQGQAETKIKTLIIYWVTVFSVIFFEETIKFFPSFLHPLMFGD